MLDGVVCMELSGVCGGCVRCVPKGLGQAGMRLGAPAGRLYIRRESCVPSVATKSRTHHRHSRTHQKMSSGAGSCSSCSGRRRSSAVASTAVAGLWPDGGADRKCQPGDVLAIRVQGNQVLYTKNGRTLARSLVRPRFPLRAAAIFDERDAIFMDKLGKQRAVDIQLQLAGHD